ncbi:hypothetical protein [Flavobacterium sp. JAS]|nr:hypothetical protein [Flavobacterium sp. JAS]MCD0470432.1 hypothetical protein [Flavobacterium sp. JAS]
MKFHGAGSEKKKMHLEDDSLDINKIAKSSSENYHQITFSKLYIEI